MAPLTNLRSMLNPTSSLMQKPVQAPMNPNGLPDYISTFQEGNNRLQQNIDAHTQAQTPQPAPIFEVQPKKNLPALSKVNGSPTQAPAPTTSYIVPQTTPSLTDGKDKMNAKVTKAMQYLQQQGIPQADAIELMNEVMKQVPAPRETTIVQPTMSSPTALTSNIAMG